MSELSPPSGCFESPTTAYFSPLMSIVEPTFRRWRCAYEVDRIASCEPPALKYEPLWIWLGVTRPRLGCEVSTPEIDDCWNEIARGPAAPASPPAGPPNTRGPLGACLGTVPETCRRVSVSPE